MSDIIPEEITANILLRLRVKDLVSCRRVSKQWLSIIDDPHFIGSQHRQSLSTSSNNSNSLLFLRDRVSCKLLYWKSDDISSSSLFSAPGLDNYYVTRPKHMLIGSCHGLLCFSVSKYRHADFLILNPLTGERHTLISKKKRRTDEFQMQYGFGYDELSDDYKVVRISSIRFSVDPNLYNCYTAEIYSVRSKGFFRTIPLPGAYWREIDLNVMGVFFGRSLHWCTRGGYNDHQRVIHAIDLVSNAHRQLQLPRTTFGQVLGLNLGIVDRGLCLCGFPIGEGNNIGFWIMKKYWDPESLNKISCITYGCNPSTLSYVGSIGEKILLILNLHILAWFDPTKKNADNSVCLTIDKKIDHILHEAIWCQESLVKIFPNNVRKYTYNK